MIPIAHNCAVGAAALSQTPYHRVPYLGFFGNHGKLPAQKLETFSPVYACGKRFTSVISKMVEIVQDKWPKGRVVLITKNKTRFGILRRNPWGDFPHFLM